MDDITNTPKIIKKLPPNGFKRGSPEAIWATWGALWIQAVFQDPLGRLFLPSWLHLGLPWGTLLEASWLLVPVLEAPRSQNGSILGGLPIASVFERFLVLFWVGLGRQKP